MRKNVIVLVCALSIYYTNLSAQIVKTIHQAFPIEKTSTKVHIDISYPFQYKVWAGDYVLVETNINLRNATQSIMDFLHESGRYKIEQYKYQTGAGLRLKKMQRKAIQTSKGLCEEKVLVTVYVPERLKIEAVGTPVASEVQK